MLAECFDSPIGPLLGAVTPDGVCLLEFVDRRALPTELDDLTRILEVPVADASQAPSGPQHAHLASLRAQLNDYFAGRLRSFTLALHTPGTPFEREVWAELQRIPYGQTCSYGDVANRINRPGAQRAVGRANGRNRIAIVIPCHRVIESNGKLRGYGGGLPRKQFLLDLERGQPQLVH